MRFAALVLTALLFPIAAPAQTSINTLPPVGTRNGANGDGITVSATGYAGSPADSATVLLYVNSKHNIGADSIKPIVDTLVSLGVDRSEILSPLLLAPDSTPAAPNTQISFTIHHPTTAQIKSAFPALAKLAAQVPDLDVNNAYVTLSLDDCQPYLDRARADAIANARTKALTIAKSLNVRLGSVKSFSDFEEQIGPRGRCTTSYSIPNYGGQRNAAPDDFVTARVTANVTIRYAIK